MKTNQIIREMIQFLFKMVIMKNRTYKCMIKLKKQKMIKTINAISRRNKKMMKTIKSISMRKKKIFLFLTKIKKLKNILLKLKKVKLAIMIKFISLKKKQKKTEKFNINKRSKLKINQAQIKRDLTTKNE